MAATLDRYTETATITTFDQNIENNVTGSYGLLANTVEEFMFDLFVQEQLMKSYLLHHVIYRYLLHFNNTFAVNDSYMVPTVVKTPWMLISRQAYGTYMHGIVGDIYHQNVTRNETANAMVGIANATERYRPGPTPLLLEA